MEANKLIEIIEAADLEPRSYSGRGMRGRYCVGVETDEPPFTLGAMLAATAAELGEDPLELAQLRSSTDQMGLRTIVYFQSVSWPEDDEDAA